MREVIHVHKGYQTRSEAGVLTTTLITVMMIPGAPILTGLALGMGSFYSSPLKCFSD